MVLYDTFPGSVALYRLHDVLFLAFFVIIITGFAAVVALRAGGTFLDLIVKFTIELCFGFFVCGRCAVADVGDFTATVGETVLWKAFVSLRVQECHATHEQSVRQF